MMGSDDGLYLFLGHTHGLSVISTSTLTCVKTWQDEQVEITSISCASFGSVTHLLGTVDDMGNFLEIFLHKLDLSPSYFVHLVIQMYYFLIRYCTGFCTSHGECLFNKSHQ